MLIGVPDKIHDPKHFLQEQFISLLKEVLSEIGHRSSNGCDAKPSSPVVTGSKDSDDVTVAEEPMETALDINVRDSPIVHNEMVETNSSFERQSVSAESGPGTSHNNSSDCNISDGAVEPSSSKCNEKSPCLQPIKVYLQGTVIAP